MLECTGGNVEAREGSCEELDRLRERTKGVMVQEYAGEKGLVELLRRFALGL